jgi:hypothetical protein
MSAQERATSQIQRALKRDSNKRAKTWGVECRGSTWQRTKKPSHPGPKLAHRPSRAPRELLHAMSQKRERQQAYNRERLLRQQQQADVQQRNQVGALVLHARGGLTW